MDDKALPRQPRISYAVARLDRTLRRLSAQRLAEFGLTVPMYTALSVLQERRGLSNAQLARRTYVSPQSMNQVIAMLEQDGLIERTPDLKHRKVLRTGLTCRGREVLARCDAAVDDLERTMLTRLGAAEWHRLRDVLATCVDDLEKSTCRASRPDDPD